MQRNKKTLCSEIVKGIYGQQQVINTRKIIEYFSDGINIVENGQIKNRKLSREKNEIDPKYSVLFLNGAKVIS